MKSFEAVDPFAMKQITKYQAGNKKYDQTDIVTIMETFLLDMNCIMK